jgi:hypothetical protein
VHSDKTTPPNRLKICVGVDSSESISGCEAQRNPFRDGRDICDFCLDPQLSEIGGMGSEN